MAKKKSRDGDPGEGARMGELERGMRDMTVGDTKAVDKLKQTKAQKKRARKIATVVNYFDTNYGTDDTNLAKWQGLCEDVGVAAGNSILECKKNLRGQFINIVEYVRAKQQGIAFRRFGSRLELSAYIHKNRTMMFPRDEAKENPILRWMLIQLC